LDVTTVMTGQKSLLRVDAIHAETREAVTAYEIHIGHTDGPDRRRPFAFVNGAPEGAISGNGCVHGSYLHGLFAADGFRRAYLNRLGISASPGHYDVKIDAALEALADHIEAHLDVRGLLALAR
jgi:adenosylcobyric acid synthase